MKRARILMAIILFTNLSLAISSFNHYPHIEAADSVLQELDPDEITTLHQPTLSSAEEFSYISEVYTWEYGYIDGKYYGQSGFSLSNLQDDGSYATLEEAADPWTGRFVYSFDIHTSIRTSYLSMEVEARGYCYSEEENLKFEWSNDGGASWTNLFSITSTSVALKSQSINTNKNSILVRAIDTSTTFGDPISSWKVDFIRVRFFDPPNSNTGLSLNILHDTDNLYPYYGAGTAQYYIFEGAASDDDGGQTITFMSLTCQTNDGAYELWRVEWDGGQWTEANGDTYIDLETTASSYSYSGSIREVRFAIQIHYEHPQEDNLRFVLRSETSTSSDTDVYYQINGEAVDVRTAVSWKSAPSLESDRVDPGGTVDMTGSVVMSDSTSLLPARNCFAYVERNPSGWTTSQNLNSDGDFTISCETVGIAGETNSFSVKIRDSYYGLDLLTGATQTVTLDEVVACDYGTTDSWIAIEDTTTLYTQLKYYSDGQEITSGTVSWNGVSMVYDALDNRWEGTTSAESNPCTITFDTLSIMTSEGVSAVRTHPTASIIWDQVIVSYIKSYRASDGIEDYNVDVGAEVQLVVQLQYQEQGGWVTDGSFSINGHLLIYTGSNGEWKTDPIVNSEVMVRRYELVELVESPSPGMNRVYQNNQYCEVIWNALMTELSVSDSVVNVGDTVRVWASITRAYDGSLVTSGTMILRHSTSSDISMRYSPEEMMWYADVVQTDVGQWSYYLHSLVDAEEHLTVVGDGIQFDGVDDYVDCGTNSEYNQTANLTLAVRFYGTGLDWGEGMFILSKKDANDAQYALYVHSDSTLRFVYYGNGLREIDLAKTITRNEWHHVIVTVSGLTLNAWLDGTQLLHDYELPAGLTSFPSVPVLLGAQRMGAEMSYHFQGIISEAQIYSDVLSSVSCELLSMGQYPGGCVPELDLRRTNANISSLDWSGSTLHGTVVQHNGMPVGEHENTRPIWNQVRVMGYVLDDPVVDVSTECLVEVYLAYAFDEKPVLYGNVTVNGLRALLNETTGRWSFWDVRYSPEETTYDLVAYSGGIYNLSSVDQNALYCELVWEQIVISMLFVLDDYIDVGTKAEIRVMAHLSCHDSHYLGLEDTLYMDGVVMPWSPNGYFHYHPSHDKVRTLTYSVNMSGAFERTWGISSISTSPSVSVTWTGLVVNFTDPISHWLNVGMNASGISVSVSYAHNGASYDGTIRLNDTEFQYFDVERHCYALLPFLGDDSLGITYVVHDDTTYAVWDGLVVDITDPFTQDLLVGQNASGIVVKVWHAYDGQPYDGLVELNNTQFKYDAPGKRGYGILSLSGGSRGITTIISDDETYARWSLSETTLHLEPATTSVPVSTFYDPQEFSVEIYLTDHQGRRIDGLVLIDINLELYAISCNDTHNTTFHYTPHYTRVYILEALYEGDSVHASAENTLELTARYREMTCEIDLPSHIVPSVEETISILHAYDADFQGQYDGVTYTRDYPIDAKFSLYWTCAEDYGEPRNYLGTWTVRYGLGAGKITIPWDLDGDLCLTDDDLVCYFVVCLDGRGVYENTTFQVKVPMKHLINISLAGTGFTFSDQALLEIEVSSLHDSAYSRNLQSEIQVYSSDDNATWSLIGANTTSSSGRAYVNWTCDISEEAFFKIVFGGNSHFTHGTKYFHAEVAKENTLLEIAQVGQFTYSDQGTILVRLTTDDDEPLSDYSLYIELKDETWTSIGSGLTNSSGYASIFWIPHLPAGVYSIQVRASMIESVCYQTPLSVSATVAVAKEIVLLTVDTSAINQDSISALVTDDEHEPIEGLRVDLYDDEDTIQSSVLSDSEGCAKFNFTPKNGERFRIVVHSNEYYGGNEERIRIHISTDINIIVMAVAGAIIGFISVTRKIMKSKLAEKQNPPPEELQKALEEEREKIPIRVREQREERIVELEGETALIDRSRDETNENG